MKIFSLFILLLLSTGVMAVIPNCNNSYDGSGACTKCINGYTLSGDGRECFQNSAKGCDYDIKAAREASKKKQGLPEGNCEYRYYASTVVNAQIGDTDNKTSIDKVISCAQKGGETLDYDACEKAVNSYNYVLMAEKAMQMQQGVRSTISTNNITKDVNQKMAEGDGQTGVLDATRKTNENISKMEKEKATAYSLAVGELSRHIFNWPKPNAKGFSRFCSQGKSKADQLEKDGFGPAAKCPEVLASAYNNSRKTVFANEAARKMLEAKGLEYGTKAIAALKNAKIHDSNAAALKNIMQGYEDPDMMIDKCVMSPNDPACGPQGIRVTHAGYQGGNFSVGGTGSNDFNFGNGEDSTFGDLGNPTGAFGDQVADLKSPFEDAAKDANSILNPASSASKTPTGGAAGGGGGGGGGMGGGGASLGNDLKGADQDDKKVADIKTSKASGGYASNGGGFQGVKGSGDDANPLAGLFDSKSEGGIEEEDRGIASEDIAGQDSGLFQKISNRYAQMRSEKRIEATNLQE